MPEDKCARCDNAEPVFWEIFTIKGSNQPQKEVKLGFCSNTCCGVFTAGIKAAGEMKIL